MNLINVMDIYHNGNNVINMFLGRMVFILTNGDYMETYNEALRKLPNQIMSSGILIRQVAWLIWQVVKTISFNDLYKWTCGF